MAHTIEDSIYRISELEQKCRKALQYESVLRQLRLKNGAFEQICALLDFIGDSENSLLAVASSELRSAFERYFLAYGILQIMYSRQVAVRAVLETFELTIPNALGVSTLTVARDRVIGHPITNDGAAHVILRGSLSENGFEYWSYHLRETKRILCTTIVS
jgi:hypothetical protein